MVFIIEKLQSYAMQELSLVDNVHGILNRVHGEMHAYFIWLFQQIFSSTPTLMLSLMLLLANYMVSHTSAVMDFSVYVNEAPGEEVLWRAIHPSLSVRPEMYDGFLNGVEVFKLSNSVGGFAGPNSVPSQMLPKFSAISDAPRRR